MNGQISVTSKVGKGSIFKIVLNDVQIADLEEGHETTIDYSENAIEFEPATIMIVDDIDYNIQVVKNMLDYKNFTFIEATSGEECLTMLEVEKPDIIFMDIRMPGISGISTTEIIKKDPKYPQMPIIAFTASVMQDQIDLIKVLFDGYLRKPVSKKQFIQTLKEHLKFSLIDQKETQNENTKDQNQIDQNCIDHLPELISDLKNNVFEQWENVCGSLVIFEIEDFSNLLIETNKKYNCNLLNQYIDKLNTSIQSFDVELIEEIVMKFKDLMDQLHQNLE
jgi:CheY-like chemotaxis protein